MDTIVSAGDARTGDRGEKLLAAGEKVSLRKWENEPAGEQSPEHANPYEYVAYVVEGRMRVKIGDAEPAEVGPGDSYVVSAETPYAFEVLERAVVVEGVSR